MRHKYHSSPDKDMTGRCTGEHCLICWMKGRGISLYGDKIVPVKVKHFERQVHEMLHHYDDMVIDMFNIEDALEKYGIDPKESYSKSMGLFKKILKIGKSRGIDFEKELEESVSGECQ